MTTPHNKANRPPHVEGRAVSYSTYVNHKCRCEGCSADHRRKYNEWRKRASKEVRTRMNSRKTRRIKQTNDALRDRLPNRGKPWTDAEIAIARDRSLTMRQAAELLGRTYYSVKQMRHTEGKGG